MSRLLIAIRGLFFHKRINIAVALGVAAATAVLTGALIVGDSMRGSLRDLTLDRLGKIDLLIMSPGFFRESMPLYHRDKSNQSEIIKVPIIYFSNGSAETADGDRRASNVSVIGLRKNFWWLYPDSTFDRDLESDEIILNATLAEDLGIDAPGQEVTIGIPKQNLLPADSSLGKKEQTFQRMPGLKVVAIIPDSGAGRFGLHPTQLPQRNCYVSIEKLQSVLASTLKFKSNRQQANMMLVASQVPNAIDVIRDQAEPTIEDLGLRVKKVTQTFGEDENSETVFDYLSISTDRMVFDNETTDSIRSVFPDAAEVFVYMANDIQLADSDKPGVPFSIVAAIDFDDRFEPLSAVTDQVAKPLGPNEVAVNQWVADDLQLKVGDKIRITYFEPESTHGQSDESTAELTVSDILKLTEPETPIQVSRRGQVTPATYDTRPMLINDPDLTPVVPGLTDATSIENWDLPFETEDKLRSQDEDYWDYYRTTPKIFVSLETGRKLWKSRFGETTSFRVNASTETENTIEKKLIDQFKQDGHLGGIQIIPIKENGLKASTGSTPFDVLFLMLSTFVIASALILVSLLFRLGIEQRSSEVGLLLASGFPRSGVTRVWLAETTGVTLLGAVLGAALGLGYAWAILWALKTWWVGAITVPFLNLHVSWWVIPAGITAGVVVCVATIYWTIRRARAQSPRGLLSGRFDESTPKPKRIQGRLFLILLAVGILVAVGTAIAAASLAGETQAIAFLFVGFLVLTMLLIATWRLFSFAPRSTGSANSLLALVISNARRNPLRSTLTIGLVAVAAFLILAISAFRLTPTEQGTAGFDYVAETSSPIFENLDTRDGQIYLLDQEQTLDEQTTVLSLRYKPGQDASCNNLYQSTQPRVLGVTDSFMDYFDTNENSFDWYTSLGKTKASQSNPWHTLNEQPDGDGVVPVVIDKNTAWYSLKVYLPGQTFTVDFDTGESVTFKLVGLLDNTLLQGSLLISESDFEKHFPDISGYRYFLINTANDSDLRLLSSSLRDQGFEARSADTMLAGFLAVQNTYLSTFQSLGALGLLLGTFGLMAVQLRSVFERRRELAVMRAVGFSRSRLGSMVLVENLLLLVSGLTIGIIAALMTTLPYVFLGRAFVPWRELLGVLVVILIVGFVTSWLASRTIQRAPLVQSLRI